jgi:S-adenosylmethionine hydrolase
MATITLTTDFGANDWFVGTIKGVIIGINPTAPIVDITHEITPGDIRAGAFALAAAFKFFPRGTIHLAVVDPGVGSTRKAIAIQTENYLWVGPDNGVLSWALQDETVHEIRQLENTDYFRTPVSQTFHGRDVFAPAAAHLSRGAKLAEFGAEARRLTKLPWPKPQRGRQGWCGEIVYVDRYGNCVTNLPAQLAARGTRVVAREKQIPLRDFYQAVGAGKAVALVSSSGFLELAINGGSAAKHLKLAVGTPVELR